LAKLAEKFTGTKFIKIDIETASFFVTKLHIRVLPCLILFHNGQIKERLIGFEEIGGGSDDFTTAELEARLKKAGFLAYLSSLQKKLKKRSSEDEDD